MFYFLMGMDPLWWIFMGAGLLVSLAATGLVRGAYARYSRVPSSRGYTGAETARAILGVHGVHDVAIEPVEGQLTDHYDPSRRVLRLSNANYQGTSLAAIGIAAHEAGHALQHAGAYAPMRIRHALVPVAGIGSNIGLFVIILGIVFKALMVVKLGIALFAAVLLFQIVTLPVEWNASSRAKRALAETGIAADRAELAGVASVLNAAALTYVAAVVSTLLMLLYFLLRSGLLGGRRD